MEFTALFGSYKNQEIISMFLNDYSGGKTTLVLLLDVTVNRNQIA